MEEIILLRSSSHSRVVRTRFAEQGLALALLARELRAARATLSAADADANTVAAQTPLGAAQVECIRSDGMCVATLEWGARGYFAPGAVVAAGDVAAAGVDDVALPGERARLVRALRAFATAAAIRASSSAAALKATEAQLYEVRQRTATLVERVRVAVAAESGLARRLDVGEAALRAEKGRLVELEDTARLHSVNGLQVAALGASLMQLQSEVAALKAEGAAQDKGAVKELASSVSARGEERVAMRKELAALEAAHATRAARTAGRVAVLAKKAEAQEQELLKSAYRISEQRKAAARTLKSMQATRLAARARRQKLGEQRAELAALLAAHAAQSFDGKQAIAKAKSERVRAVAADEEARAAMERAAAVVQQASAHRARAKAELRAQREAVVAAHASIVALKAHHLTLTQQRMGAEDRHSRAVELAELNATLARLDEEKAAARRAKRAKYGPPWQVLPPAEVADAAAGKARAPPPCTVDSPVIAHILATWTRDVARQAYMRDWLYAVIYGASTGKARPRDLQLNRLAGEVRAGFEELILPLLRQRYGIQLEISARSVVETRSDVRLIVRPKAAASVGSVDAMHGDALLEAEALDAEDALKLVAKRRAFVLAARDLGIFIAARRRQSAAAGAAAAAGGKGKRRMSRPRSLARARSPSKATQRRRSDRRAST